MYCAIENKSTKHVDLMCTRLYKEQDSSRSGLVWAQHNLACKTVDFNLLFINIVKVLKNLI
jgi:hypothetical protein